MASNGVNEISDSSRNSMISPSENDDNVLKLQSSSENTKKKNKRKLDAGETHHGEAVKNSSSWIKSDFLGRGTHGSVYIATRKGDKEENNVAIKEAEISNASSLMHEKKILTRLVSPFVVRCYGHEIAREETLFGGVRTKYNLILEYCSGQSLSSLIKKNGGLWEKDVKTFAKDILLGLQYIHSENIIHCDVKPANIFLIPVDNQTKPNGFVIKIGDFGAALEKGSVEYGDGLGHNEIGTTRYMSPEFISHGIVDYSVDTWAFGCTVLEMLTGQEPWGEHTGFNDSEDWESLIAESRFVPYIPDWLSEEAQDFLEGCLVREAGERWEISALVNHPFLNLDVE